MARVSWKIGDDEKQSTNKSLQMILTVYGRAAKAGLASQQEGHVNFQLLWPLFKAGMHASLQNARLQPLTSQTVRSPPFSQIEQCLGDPW